MDVADDGRTGRAEACCQFLEACSFRNDFQGQGGKLGAGHGSAPGLGGGLHDGDPGRETAEFRHDALRPGLELLKGHRKEIQDRNIRARLALAAKVVVDAFLKDGEDELVATDGAEEGLVLDAGHEAGVAGDNSGLGPPQ